MDVRSGGGRARLALRGSVASVVLALLGLGLSVTLSSGSSATSNTAPQLGVYAGGGNVGGVNSLGQAIGSQPQYAMDFLDGTSWASITDPSYFTSVWHDSGYDMIWGIPMVPATGATLAEGATGAYNQYFVTLSQELVAAGQGDSILRIGWEFNGGWFPWAAGGQAANFVDYWRQIVTAIRSVPGANFQFEWNPTRGDQGVGNLADYYPGDAYVDLIGMDVYDTEWANYPGAATEFSDMETQAYGLDWLASFAAAHHKQITFPEWGLGWGPSDNGGPVSDPGQQVSGGDDPIFISDMASWIASHNVLEATYWDYGSSSVASGSNPNTLAALAAGFGPNSSTSTTTTTTSTTTPPTTTTSTTTPPTTTTSTTTPPTTTTTTQPPTKGTPPSGASTTTLAVSNYSADYGAEGTTQFTVTVSPAVTGPVKVDSTWTLCMADVTNGVGTCSLSNNDLSVGTYALTALFGGTNGVPGSTSAPVAFAVNPRPVTLGLSVSPTSVPYQQEDTAVITAQVTVPTGGIAKGTVTVSSGLQTVCTITLSGGTGTCSPNPGTMAGGSYPLIGTYSGDGWDAQATAATAAPLVITGDGGQTIYSVGERWLILHFPWRFSHPG